MRMFIPTFRKAPSLLAVKNAVPDIEKLFDKLHDESPYKEEMAEITRVCGDGNLTAIVVEYLQYLDKEDPHLLAAILTDLFILPAMDAFSSMLANIAKLAANPDISADASPEKIAEELKALMKENGQSEKLTGKDAERVGTFRLLLRLAVSHHTRGIRANKPIVKKDPHPPASVN